MAHLDPSDPSPDLSANLSGADAIYAEIRRRVGDPSLAGAPPEIVDVADDIAAVAMRTPTLPPATHTHCYLVGRGEMIAIDPGSPFRDQQDALVPILAARGHLAAVVLTHHHGDHVGGAAALAAATGVPIWAHAATAAALAGRIAVTRTLVDDEVLAIGGRRVRVVFTPGHAPGHLVFFDEASRALVAGDMVAGVGTILIDPGDGHMATYLASLKRMAGLSPGVLLPAHGPVITDGPGKLAEYVAHRRMREARVRSALADDVRSSREICAVAYADTPSVLWPLAERSALAHLQKLVEDGDAVESAEGWRRAS